MKGHEFYQMIDIFRHKNPDLVKLGSFVYQIKGSTGQQLNIEPLSFILIVSSTYLATALPLLFIWRVSSKKVRKPNVLVCNGLQFVH